ncbi:MAG: hypothetical protein QXF56_05125 [Candidatus Micrarchaeia archaeon]
MKRNQKSEISGVETDDFLSNMCKVADLSKIFLIYLKIKKVLICMGKDPSEVILKNRPIQNQVCTNVEVKPKTYHFGKKIGQTLGYSLCTHRVYLACKEEFTTPQIELASQLGVGLIQIKRKYGCSEVVGSRLFQPDKEKMLKLLVKMNMGECMLCGSLISLDNYSNSFNRALERGIPYEFVRDIETKDMPSYKGKEKVVHQWLYICPLCLQLFGKHYKFR